MSVPAPPVAAEVVLWRLVDAEDRQAMLVEEMESANAGLEAGERAEKFDKMAKSAFTFLRGSAHLFHRDLETSRAVEGSAFEIPGTATWIQGDAHILNVGAFGDGDGHVVYDLSDFDQAWIGNYLVDVWRLAVSLRLLADDAGLEGAADPAVLAFAEAYLEQVLAFAGNDDEKSFSLDSATASGPALRLIREAVDEEGPKVMLREWVRGRGERRRFRDHEDLAAAGGAVDSELRAAIESYARDMGGFATDYFKVLDTARRLHAGIGSLGVDRFYVLIEGPRSRDKDDVILDLKWQPRKPSLASLFLGPSLPFGGCRVALAEEAMLARADPHLGCVELSAGSFSVRQRNPFKKSMKPRKLEGGRDLEALGREVARALASAHSRSDRDFDAARIPGSFDDAVAESLDTPPRRQKFALEVASFAAAYARQVEVDFGIFQQIAAR